jgi:hypothetical protein
MNEGPGIVCLLRNFLEVPGELSRCGVWGMKGAGMLRSFVCSL